MSTVETVDPALAAPRRGRPPSAERRETTRRRILDAAGVVLLEKGYNATSIDDVVRASGLSKGGFYFYFPSKEAMFEALYDEISEVLYQRVVEEALAEQDPLDQLAAGVRAFLRGCYELRTAKLMFSGGMNPLIDRKRRETTDRFAGLIEDSLVRAVAEGLIPRVDTRILARALVGAFSELGMEVVRQDDPARVEEVADALVDVICFLALSATLPKGLGASA